MLAVEGVFMRLTATPPLHNQSSTIEVHPKGKFSGYTCSSDLGTSKCRSLSLIGLVLGRSSESFNLSRSFSRSLKLAPRPFGMPKVQRNR